MGEPVLHADRVGFLYPQHGRGLAEFSLQAGAGEPLLIAGPSGCGKSTLARCLSGLIPHLYRGQMTGRVWIDERCTRETPLWQLSEHAGMVFQNPAAQMLAESVEEEIVFGLENLGLPGRMIHRRLEEALERFDLQELRRRRPQMLSGGEQQKVALAAVMARQPPVLVLDEPLSMLDSGAASDLVSALADLSGAGTAVVTCEHRGEWLHALPGLRTVELGTQALAAEGAALPPAGPFPEPAAEPPRLELSSLSVQRGRTVVLHDVHWRAAGGQVLAIAGRNGVGKTTLLRALAGLQRYSGTVVVHEAGSAATQRPDLGLVFQNPDLQLFNPTVRQELLYGLSDPDMARYEWLLDVLALRRYEETPPLLLSEGEKKRAALATVLMRRPRHGLLLDEPTLGQDMAHKTILVRLLRALAQAGQMVIVATHDLSLARQADRLLLLDRTGFVADGPPDQVLHDRQLWAKQGLPVPDWVWAR